ncbi:hypothetical protein [Paramagnetospirillum magneticum]|uniref:Uncharacterized protein n=1 Tax=Paramagnetospirillum magneticum (strain ATCC 700264 / AMB-1) TaxID=342108 RepID=Q2W7B7_PARM1|nr:hypothetical protein [Paramagnetospirillum magneticum]BAE50258.1 hypothetical protein amb1453 [Paramagnetospirillum magneticum AMB-1]
MRLPYAYRLCTWRVDSDLLLPELITWGGGGDGSAADLVIVQGSVPDHLDDAVTPGKFIVVGADGSVLLHIRNLVRILVQDGRRITVEILRRDPEESWRLFLLGSTLAILCHQRGAYPLHAASLRIGGRTLALAGHTGAGKSTLALGLVNRGHQLLSDDLSVLRAGSDGVDLLPAYPRLKLWRKSLEALGVGVEGLPRVRGSLEKYGLSPSGPFDPQPSRLDGIVVLKDGPLVRIERMRAVAAVPDLRSHVQRPGIGQHLRGAAALLAEAGRIAEAVPVYRLERPKTFDDVGAMVELIEALPGR